MVNEEKYMRRCLQLARLGKGHVAPNPMVGSVIVHEDRIIGEGYHTAYGKSHAEVEAINSVADKSLLKDSTVYVNLEPCSHYGKTPPCADRLISEGIRRVVVAALDPNPLVSGNGIRKLLNAGIEVETGILETDALELNRRFYCFHQKKRSYVILKWAQTANGIMANPDGKERLMISSGETNQLVHKWRSEEPAILVGKNTALLDDPLLNVRHWTGKDPMRFVIDAHLQLPEHLRLFNDGNPTIILNLLSDKHERELSFVKIKEISAREVLSTIRSSGYSSVLIEGGLKTLRMFIEAGLWDEARVITSGATVAEGIHAPLISGELRKKFTSGTDTVSVLRNPSSL